MLVADDITARPGFDAPDVRNIRISEFALDDRLNPLERDWLVSRLLEKRGIAAARDPARDGRRLLVEYDADAVSATDVREFLSFCGVCARPVRIAS